MLRSLFGLGPKVDITRMISDGALILDVRTPDEFRRGHVRGSTNIPLDRLAKDLKKLDKQRAIVACCQSGMRSGSAVAVLERNGYTAHNGGSWMNVQSRSPK
ncbi:MAG: rhodanese-like domain-containing protein [Flavobacteriales bacterium]|nr:rhodanese-like domain-containing protein [Flavobacteriales bacterium]